MNKQLYGRGRNVTHLIKTRHDAEHYFSGDSYCGRYIFSDDIDEYKPVFDICKKCIKIKSKLESK